MERFHARSMFRRYRLFHCRCATARPRRHHGRPDPDKWIQQGLKDIAQGKTDDFARNYLALIDKPNSFDPFAANLRVLQQFGAPVFMEKVVDVKYGGALREVIYLALYRRTDYVYFKFVIKKNSGGWLISDFAFKSERLGSLSPRFRHVQVRQTPADQRPRRQRLGRRMLP